MQELKILMVLMLLLSIRILWMIFFHKLKAITKREKAQF